MSLVRTLTWLAVFAVLALGGTIGVDELRQVGEGEDLSSDQDTGAQIVRAVDGDTVRVIIDGSEQTVRVLGIDTPETVKPGIKPECGGPEASAAMKRLAPAGARVKLIRDSTQDNVDRYGRILRTVVVDGRDVALQLVRSGLADVYIFAGNPSRRVPTYQRAQARARSQNRGVFGDCNGDFHSLQ